VRGHRTLRRDFLGLPGHEFIGRPRASATPLLDQSTIPLKARVGVYGVDHRLLVTSRLVVEIKVSAKVWLGFSWYRHRTKNAGAGARFHSHGEGRFCQQ
jgi:hypothetical protein